MRKLDHYIKTISALSWRIVIFILVLLAILVAGIVNTCNGQSSFWISSGDYKELPVFNNGYYPTDICYCDTVKPTGYLKKTGRFDVTPKISVDESDSDSEAFDIRFSEDYGIKHSDCQGCVSGVIRWVTVKNCNGVWMVGEKILPYLNSNPTQRPGNIVHRGVFANEYGIWQIGKPPADTLPVIQKPIVSPIPKIR